MLEKDVARDIDKILDMLGVFHWRNNTGRRGGVSFGATGSPDFIAILPGGIFFGIEVKKADGKQSSMQVAFQTCVEESGGLYMVARSAVDVVSFIYKNANLPSHNNDVFIKWLGVNGHAGV